MKIFVFVALTVIGMLGFAQAQTQAPSADELTRHTIERRAVEAVIWGMPMSTMT